MKRLAIGIALGLVAAPLTGCDKEETKAAEGEKKGKDGEKKGKDGAEAGKDAAPKALTAADAVKFIPEGATMVMGLDAAKVAGSAVFKANKALMQQGDAGEVMAAAEACKVGMETWKFALMGGDTEKDDAMVLIASATGLGTKTTLECIAAEAKKKNPEDELTISEADGMVTATSKDGKSTGYGVSDDVFVMAGKDYAESVKALIKGEGKSAADGSLKDILAATDRSAHVYFGAIATKDMKQGPAADLQHVTGAVDLSKGLALNVAADFGAEDKATALAAEAQKQFDAVKGMGAAMGVPAPVVESVKIAAKGTKVEVTAKASEEELAAISKTLQAQMK